MKPVLLPADRTDANEHAPQSRRGSPNGPSGESAHPEAVSLGRAAAFRAADVLARNVPPLIEYLRSLPSWCYLAGERSMTRGSLQVTLSS